MISDLIYYYYANFGAITYPLIKFSNIKLIFLDIRNYKKLKFIDTEFNDSNQFIRFLCNISMFLQKTLVLNIFGNVMKTSMNKTVAYEHLRKSLNN